MKMKYDEMSDSEKVKRLGKHFIWHIALYAFMYNILPLAFLWQEEPTYNLYMLLVGYPAVTYIAGMIFGFFNRFRWQYILFSSVLFIPAALIYYSSDALIYAVLYAVCATFGMLVAMILTWLFKTKTPILKSRIRK
ncbi:MAG: hypothetical protein WCY62_06420 [Clostridia bacterium]